MTIKNHQVHHQYICYKSLSICIEEKRCKSKTEETISKIEFNLQDQIQQCSMQFEITLGEPI